MKRYVCIHGHFYQPPRENPWLELVEREDSAHPAHDWNQRVTAECYSPNAASRILNGDGKIVKIVNNYSWISFNFGPTLLSWMERYSPEVYGAILEADRISAQRFDGFGSAIAQVYNHLIMPLADRRDKETQVIWGIRDFQFRFGRPPVGMWLSECAVDTETLEVLVENGIQFTILAPHQVEAIRELGSDEWTPVPGELGEFWRPYLVKLPSGGEIAVFFYCGPVARGVAFQGLLQRGETFAHKLLESISSASDQNCLAHIATDGETYGHHHPYGDMALAYAIDYIHMNKLAQLTNYAAYLRENPPRWEAKILENSSWSCAHGVERWRNDCGCKIGTDPSWHQKWRRPMREAFDWLRDKGRELFETIGRKYIKDPWAARNDYIDLILERTPERVEKFIQKHCLRPLGAEARTTVFQLMEMQRHLMLMYTSCGWFFDDISGIEATQVMRYAARALQLGELLSHRSWRDEFVEKLSSAPSNLPQFGHGGKIFREIIEPQMLELSDVARHWAVLSLFDSESWNSKNSPVFEVKPLSEVRLEVGREKLNLAQVEITSRLTEERERVRLAVLYFGWHNIFGVIDDIIEPHEFESQVRKFKEKFYSADTTGVFRLLAQYFDGPNFSISSLFKDFREEVISYILKDFTAELEHLSQQLYDRYAPLIRYLRSFHLELPFSVREGAEWVLQSNIQRCLNRRETLNLQKLDTLLREARELNIQLDWPHIEMTLLECITEKFQKWLEDPESLTVTEEIVRSIRWLEEIQIDLNLFQLQNRFYKLRSALAESYRKALKSDQPERRRWAELISQLNNSLKFHPLEENS